MLLQKECETCKKRRVKCDGVKPNCVRCTKAHRMCVFTDGRDQTFTFVDDATQLRHKRKRKAANKVVVTGKRTRVDMLSPFELQQQQPPPHFALPPSLDDQAVSFYFHVHHCGFLNLVEPARGHASLLPAACNKSSSQSALHSALLARSYAAFGKARRDALMSSASAIHYAGAIGKIKEALLNPTDACSDEILLATMVLSPYDNTWSTDTDDSALIPFFRPAQRMLQSLCRHDGATTLLRLRRSEPAKNTDLNLDKLVRRHVLRSALLRGCGIPDFLEYGELFGESGIHLGLDRHMAQLIKVQRYVSLLRPYYQAAQEHRRALNLEPLTALLYELARLDEDMISWTRKLPVEWSYTATSLGEGKDVSTSMAHSYKSPDHAGTWNRHRAVRILGKKASIELLHLVEHFCDEHHEPLIQSLVAEIRVLIDEVCASSMLFQTPDDAMKDQSRTRIETSARRLMDNSILAPLAFPFHAIVDALPFAKLSREQESWIRNKVSDLAGLGYGTILKQPAVQV